VQFQVPEAVLQRRWTSSDHPVEQVLIKWSMMPATLATWEPYEQLRHQFPRAPAWGHAGSQQGGNVNTVLPSQSSEEPPVSRPIRKKKPNPFVAGLDWL